MMRGTTRPTRVFQRGDTWWFRAKVPRDLRGILGRREYRYSLKTKSLGIAASKACQLSREVDEQIAAARAKAMAMPRDGRTPAVVHQLTDGQIEAVFRDVPLDLIGLNWATARESGNWTVAHNRAVDRILKRQGHIVPANSRLFAELRLRLSYLFDETEFPLWDGPQPDSGRTIGQMVTDYESERFAHMSGKTRAGVHTVLGLMIDVIGENHAVSSIGQREIEQLHNCLTALPPNRKRRSAGPGQSLALIASAARKLGMPALSPRSLQTYAGYLQTFFAFVDRQGEGGHKLESFWKSAFADQPKEARYRKRAFTDRELLSLFAAPVFTGCLDDGRGFSQFGLARPRRGRFWIPLLALFGGVPLEEACRLVGHAVTRQDDRYEIHSDDSCFRLPLDLSDLGFDACLDRARKRPDGRLFPELTKGQSGYFSDPFSQWFRRLLRTCELGDGDLSYYSLILTHRLLRQHASGLAGHETTLIDAPALQAILKQLK